MRERVCLISSLFAQFGHNPGTGYKNKKKHLIPPSASRLPNTPQWLNNQRLAQTPVCHLISMLIASGLTIAGERHWVKGLSPRLAHCPPTLTAPLVIEQRKQN